MLNNFRTAVKDTNVILNQNVSPGLLIIPSSLIILEHPIPGYNNYLTTSSADMRFGTNTGLNKAIARPQAVKESKGGQSVATGTKFPTPPSKHNNEGAIRETPKKYSYHGPLLGATGNETSEKTDNSIFWGIVAAISGLVVFEIVISRDGVSFKSKDR